MKKGLSVLLIAAALFGFYGGAVNIQDVLAAKDYWEKKSEQTTADLNKLEDGLNTLEENKEAYLDGVDKVAEGEKTLAEGEETLAQGEADYAAAPGKLADARRQLAEGQDALDEGAGKLKKLKTAIGGVNKILNGYTNKWRPGYEALKDGRKQIADGSKGAKDSLTALAAFLDSGQKAYLAAVEDVAADDNKQNAKDYKDFVKSTNQLAKDIPKIQKAVKEKSENATALYNNLDNFAKGDPSTEEGITLLMTFAGACAQYKDSMDTLSGLPAVKTKFSSDVATLAGKYGAYAQKNAVLDQKKEAVKTAYAKVAKYDTNGDQQFSEEEKANIPADELPNLAAYGSAVEEAQAAGADVKAAVEDAISVILAKKGTILEGMKQASGYLAGVNEQVNGDGSLLKNKLLPGLQKFNKEVTADKIDDLTDGQDEIAGGIATIASGVLNNKELKAGVRKAMGGKTITILRRYSGKSSPAYTKNANFAKFEKQMDKSPGLVSLLKKARKYLGKTRSSGLKTYNAGVKKLNAGKAQYAQGLKDYEEAPAKLEEGRQKLADGRKELAAGKEKLAEYEDGEQQVRDGLATLMESQRYADLETILERRNGDDNFDAADKSLDIPDGLDAVGTGREYQSATGEIITSELKGRIIGSALELGAAAIAVLAALLSLLKKFKGAAAAAVAAAAVGVSGIITANNAGMEMSTIAGSNIGATPVLAAGILAAVAAVFSVVHFTAKKDA